MSTVVKDLWPATLPAKPVPNPVKILREQGVLLQRKTNDLLYGEVLDAAIPSVRGLRYSFHVCVSRKPIRHKLISIECGLLFDYPVTIENHLAGDTTTVSDKEAFEDQLRLIFDAPPTNELIGRLLTFARQ